MSIVTIVTDRPKYARISTFNDRLLEYKSQNDRLNTLDNVDMFKNRFFVKYITICVVFEVKLNQYAKYTRTICQLTTILIYGGSNGPLVWRFY